MISKNTPLSITAVVSLSFFVAVGCGSPPPDEGADDNQQNQSEQNDDNQQNDNNDNTDPNAQNNNDNQNNDNQNNDNGVEDDDCYAATDRSTTFDIPAPDDATGAGGVELLRVGDELWVTFGAAVGIDGNDVEKGYFARLGCDGELIDEPMLVGSGEPFDATPPSLGTDGSVAYLVWVEEVEEEVDGQPELRFQSKMTSFDVDGDPVVDEPLTLQFQGLEGPLEDVNVTDVDVNHDGNAVIAGYAPHRSEGNSVIARFDEDGQPDGDPFYLEVDSSYRHLATTVSVMDDHHVMFAFVEESDWGAGEVRHGSVRPDGQQVDEGPTAAEAALGEGNLSTTVALSKNSAGGHTWMVFPRGTDTGNNLRLRPATQVGVVDTEGSRLSDRFSTAPSVTASENGGAKAWFSAGPDGPHIHYRRFDGTAVAIGEMGPIINEDHDEDPEGGPAITWIAGDRYASVWPEGGEITGRIIDFGWEE